MWKESNISSEIEKCEERKIEKVKRYVITAVRNFYMREATLHIVRKYNSIGKKFKNISYPILSNIFLKLFRICSLVFTLLMHRRSRPFVITRKNAHLRQSKWHYEIFLVLRTCYIFMTYEHCAIVLLKGHTAK